MLLLGMKIFSPHKVGIHGFNPFPWPVEINFRGLNISAFSDHINIKFPNGKEKYCDSPGCTDLFSRLHLFYYVARGHEFQSSHIYRLFWKGNWDDHPTIDDLWWIDPCVSQCL